MKHIFLFCLVLTIILSSCTSNQATATETTEADMSLEITSDAFVSGQSIPAKYTCTGKNISPAITWGDPPAGTQSFALIMDDPDAPMGTWVHWVLYNIPADRRSLEEALPVTGKNVANTNSIFVGTNSWGNIGYGGPCPPSGTHRYCFKLYALDTTISLLPGATKDELLREMKGHILAQGELMGTFSK
jgi:Raf kinase inhibitor-like YbhB/YbcL family protein